MKAFRQALLAVSFAAISIRGLAVENVSPALAPILDRIIERAKLEGENDHSFKQLYSFSREKVTEYYNGAGALIKRDVKDGVHQPNPDAVAPVATPSPAKPTGDTIAKEQHPALQGQSFDKNELLNPNVFNRFQFTLAGQEKVDGRDMYVIDFAPIKKDLPEHTFKDRFINKAAGRVWVDAADYTIAKADLHLIQKVDVAFGLIGSIWKFNYSFDRVRTDDGVWFTKESAWHVEGREGIVNRTIDHTETLSNIAKVSSLATR